jgi:hypothetical protein
MSKAKNPVNLYISQCCNSQAEKEPCERSKEDKAEKKFGEATLGTWRCPGCGKKCKVLRKKNLDRKKE